MTESDICRQCQVCKDYGCQASNHRRCSLCQSRGHNKRSCITDVNIECDYEYDYEPKKKRACTVNIELGREASRSGETHENEACCAMPLRRDSTKHLLQVSCDFLGLFVLLVTETIKSIFPCETNVLKLTREVGTKFISCVHFIFNYSAVSIGILFTKLQLNITPIPYCI